MTAQNNNSNPIATCPMAAGYGSGKPLAPRRVGRARQKLPIVVVEAGGRYIVIDGYKRRRALTRLSRATVIAIGRPMTDLDVPVLERSRRWVSRRLGLIQTWPAPIHERVRAGELNAHAAMKCLLSLVRANTTAAACRMRPFDMLPNMRSVFGGRCVARDRLAARSPPRPAGDAPVDLYQRDGRAAPL